MNDSRELDDYKVGIVVKVASFQSVIHPIYNSWKCNADERNDARTGEEPAMKGMWRLNGETWDSASQFRVRSRV